MPTIKITYIFLVEKNIIFTSLINVGFDKNVDILEIPKFHSNIQIYIYIGYLLKSF